MPEYKDEDVVAEMLIVICNDFFPHTSGGPIPGS